MDNVNHNLWKNFLKKRDKIDGYTSIMTLAVFKEICKDG